MTARSKSAWIPVALALGAAGVLILAGCAPQADTGQIQSDQFALRGMVASDQQQIDALQEKISRLNDRVA